jgi:Fe-S cluster assembly protein SufD
MTTGNRALAQAAEGFSARFRKLAPRLPGPAEARLRAASAFRARGFPDTHDEAFRFTNLRPLADVSFSEPDGVDETALALLARVPASEGPCLVFANGRFRAERSRLPGGFHVASFADEPALEGALAEESTPLTALNTMLAEDGAVISVPAGVDAGTLVLVSLGTGEAGRAVDFHPRHRVILAAGARLALIEIALGEGVYLHNPVMDATLGTAARLLHVKLQNESTRAFHLSSLHVGLDARAAYEGFSLVSGARLARSEIHADINGAGAALAMNVAQLLDGERHADITAMIRHLAPGGSSRQAVKNVLTGRAQGVFQGKIAVDRVAQKTDGYQMNQALLLSDEAQVNSKPELEIFADDVKCSHGATVGALDPEQLFYLRSRGVPGREARAILVRAFLAEMLETIPHEWGRSVLENAVDSWWKDRPV